jgi:hypothetical protein
MKRGLAVIGMTAQISQELPSMTHGVMYQKQRGWMCGRMDVSLIISH